MAPAIQSPVSSLPQPLLTQRENIPLSIFALAADASVHAAEHIASFIRQKAEANEQAVLGLATGSTPTALYAHLIKLHREQDLSFSNVVTFNLDEYFPIQPDALQSYHRFMGEQLFNHIDIPPENINIPDGSIPLEAVPEHCAQYEQLIEEAGGIDIQLLGVGRSGHIGFNEPGSALSSRTRLISLDNVTRTDAAADFFGKQHVPRRAITMGIDTILRAKQVLLLAFGEGKSHVIAQAVEGPVTGQLPASYLQQHSNTRFLLDEAAAEQLTRYTAPWLLGPIDWHCRLRQKAVIWLAHKTNKPILKLTEEDYNENHLQDILAEDGPAYKINLRVFRRLQQTITGWPGGKPDYLKQPGDRARPHDEIFPKRVLIFSPHPDDDVISMGGTLLRLVEHGHDVHIAYQVSGSIAVFDEDALRFADFAADFNQIFDIEQTQTERIETHTEQFLRNKKPGQIDSPEIQKLKALIRRGEARAAARHCGVPLENLHFLDMPFYETGTIRKNPLGQDDIDITINLLNTIKPHQIYAAGDLSDPHGTHRTCLAAVTAGYNQCADQTWHAESELWLYRGAWQEWEPQQIDMAVPLSPDELLKKRIAIFKHESQKDKAMFPGSDRREFWQRAEDRNKQTAATYDKLGLAEYEALEGFVRWTQDSPPACSSDSFTNRNP